MIEKNSNNNKEPDSQRSSAGRIQTQLASHGTARHWAHGQRPAPAVNAGSQRPLLILVRIRETDVLLRQNKRRKWAQPAGRSVRHDSQHDNTKKKDVMTDTKINQRCCWRMCALAAARTGNSAAACHLFKTNCCKKCPLTRTRATVNHCDGTNCQRQQLFCIGDGWRWLPVPSHWPY